VCRLVPGVLPDEECYVNDSHWDGLLEHPQYTRPESWRGRTVPEVLLSGNHAKINEWRHTASLRRTQSRRPDMYEKLPGATPAPAGAPPSEKGAGDGGGSELS
jgi:tRNA (guanine37-N1)-methyltransferase